VVQKHETEVIVAGAGPVGMVCALDLARKGLSVEIVDEERRPASHSYALALHARSIELLEDLGVRVAAHPYALTVEGLAFYEGAKRRAELDFGAVGRRHSGVVVLRQSHLERALEEALARHGVKVRWNHRVSAFEERPDRVEVEVQRLDSVSTGYAVARSEREVTHREHRVALFLVGADGQESLVRRVLGTPVRMAGPALQFAVFEFQSGVDPGREVRVVLDEATTSVQWPLKDARCRWSFQLEAPDAGGGHHKSRAAAPVGKDYFPVLTESVLRELLAERAPWNAHPIGEIYWSTIVTFEPRLVERFGRDRVWLAGDAAHVTGPVGIHSMNAGFLEATDLAAGIQRCVSGEASVSSLDDGYARRWDAEWRMLLGLIGGPVARPDAPDWVRKDPLRVLGCLPAMGPDLAALASRVGLDLVRSGIAPAAKA
jgi:2-polyprenyl-6-methoxyphenol hydroxylase-like FAD-dependent oxidoreductase